MFGFTSLLGAAAPRAGLQGTQQGQVRATIYRGKGLLTLSNIALDGNRAADERPSIVQAQVQMMLGGAAQFQLTLKVPESLDMLSAVQDDDWIDIELGLNGVFWHVLRGLVDQVRVSVSVAGNGSVTRSCLVTGQSFQKVWHQTPMWFSSIYADVQSLQSGQGSTANLAMLGIGQSVPDTVSSFLFSYANRVAKAGRASLAMPIDLPGAAGEFGTSWRLDAKDFSDADAPRRSLLVNAYHPNQNVWDVAQTWSDPYFVEMFTAQLPLVGARLVPREGSGSILQRVNAGSAMSSLSGEANFLPRGLSVDGSAMTLVVRNKPFICVSPRASARIGFASPWFSLPMMELSPQQVSAVDLGKNGMERVNAFFCASQLITGAAGSSLADTALPLWSVADMQDHGMRPMDVMTQYVPVDQPPITPTSTYLRLRARLRDWYCANHLLLSGNITLGQARPQLQPGVRLRLLAQQERDQVTGYVESVVHNYAPGMGLSTSVGITRAYVGSDAQHLAELRDLVGEYSSPL